MSADETTDAELPDVAAQDVYRPSYGILWVPVVIVIWFFLSLIVVALAPRNEHFEALHFGPGGSALVVYVFGLAPFLVVTLLAAARAARYAWIARREERAIEVAPELKPGPLVVAGTVVPRLSGAAPVRLEVEQHATTALRWEEVARRVRCTEFDIRLPSGELLPVRPDERLVLMDDLDGLEELGTGKRARIAQLSPDEPVYAVGELVEGDEPLAAERKGYRSAPQRGLVLQRPSRGPLVLSSKPLGEPFRARAKSFRKWAVRTVALMAAVHGTLFLTYHARTFVGSTELAQVIRLHQYANEEGHYFYDVYAQTVEPPLHVVHEEARERTFRKLEQGAFISVRLVRGAPIFDQIGRHPTVAAPLIFPAVVLAGGWVALFLLLAGGQRQWYEKRKLVDVVAQTAAA